LFSDKRRKDIEASFPPLGGQLRPSVNLIVFDYFHGGYSTTIPVKTSTEVGSGPSLSLKYTNTIVKDSPIKEPIVITTWNPEFEWPSKRSALAGLIRQEQFRGDHIREILEEFTKLVPSGFLTIAAAIGDPHFLATCKAASVRVAPSFWNILTTIFRARSGTGYAITTAMGSEH